MIESDRWARPEPSDYIKPIVAGASIVIVGLAPWTILAPITARVRPETPWAALTSAAFLLSFVAWRDGAGWPRRSSGRRRQRLRLWPQKPGNGARADVPSAALLVLALMMLGNIPDCDSTRFWLLEYARMGLPRAPGLIMR